MISHVHELFTKIFKVSLKLASTLDLSFLLWFGRDKMQLLYYEYSTINSQNVGLPEEFTVNQVMREWRISPRMMVVFPQS